MGSQLLPFLGSQGPRRRAARWIARHDCKPDQGPSHGELMPRPGTVMRVRQLVREARHLPALGVRARPATPPQATQENGLPTCQCDGNELDAGVAVQLCSLLGWRTRSLDGSRTLASLENSTRPWGDRLCTPAIGALAALERCMKNRAPSFMSVEWGLQASD